MSSNNPEFMKSVQDYLNGARVPYKEETLKGTEIVLGLRDYERERLASSKWDYILQEDDLDLVDIANLRFLRWMVKEGRVNDGPVGVFHPIPVIRTIEDEERERIDAEFQISMLQSRHRLFCGAWWLSF